MSVENFALAFLDDVGVGLENGKYLFVGRHVFPQQDAAPALVDDPLGKRQELVELRGVFGGREHLFKANALVRCQGVQGSARVGHGLLRQGDQPYIQGLFVVLPAGVVDVVEQSLGRAAMIVECPAQAWDVGFDPLQNTREHPDAVPQLVRVGGVVNIGLDARRVDTHPLPVFHALVARVSDDEVVDGLPRLWPYAFDVFLQRGEHGDFFRPNANDFRQRSACSLSPANSAIRIPQINVASPFPAV